MQSILNHFPYNYLDARREIRANEARGGEYALIRASAAAPAVGSHIRRGLYMTRAALRETAEGGAEFTAVWFNQLYVKKTLIPGVKYLFFGRAERLRNGKLQLLNSLFEPANALKRLGKILPLYRKFTDGETVIQPAKMQSILQKALNQNTFENILRPELAELYRLMPTDAAYREVHDPVSIESAEAARRSLQTEELALKLAVYSALRERESGQARQAAYAVTDAQIELFQRNFPFTLTDDQKGAARAIAGDLRGSETMNRLLEGDVGSGKTAVAMCTLFMAAASGHQAVFMAPTEVLAEQHYQNLLKVFADSPFRIVLLTGSMKKAERDGAYFHIKFGECAIVVGTHAVFSAGVEFADLTLVVTDEQHRFGVAQRGALEKKGVSPDVLALSATPIPRTLSLALYGDLKVSRLRSARVARDVMTGYVGAEKRDGMIGFVAERLAAGERAYFICPRVEKNDDVDGEEEQANLTDVKTLAAELKKTPLAAHGIGILHGRMKEADKAKALNAFAAGEAKTLVATTVVEVGIDVPDATVIVICNADRFGLSQLHQLRGRVGRRGQKAWCFLLADGQLNEIAVNRLSVLKATDDGFKLAEYDYEQRGAGDFMGLRQHGGADAPLSADTVRVAREIANSLLDDPSARPKIEAAADHAGGGDLENVVFN